MDYSQFNAYLESLVPEGIVGPIIRSGEDMEEFNRHLEKVLTKVVEDTKTPEGRARIEAMRVAGEKCFAGAPQSDPESVKALFDYMKNSPPGGIVGTPDHAEKKKEKTGDLTVPEGGTWAQFVEKSIAPEKLEEHKRGKANMLARIAEDVKTPEGRARLLEMHEAGVQFFSGAPPSDPESVKALFDYMKNSPPGGIVGTPDHAEKKKEKTGDLTVPKGGPGEKREEPHDPKTVVGGKSIAASKKTARRAAFAEMHEPKTAVRDDSISTEAETVGGNGIADSHDSKMAVGDDSITKEKKIRRKKPTPVPVAPLPILRQGIADVTTWIVHVNIVYYD